MESMGAAARAEGDKESDVADGAAAVDKAEDYTKADTVEEVDKEAVSMGCHFVGFPDGFIYIFF
jgi:hypothetical protein